ncbi:hypothetical protein FPV67DRAFT_1671327 [Lyophyllum atratum]|nr:hypothetical protein FPV67DRAFT_1671327 [Lyophyllum atratum]
MQVRSVNQSKSGAIWNEQAPKPRQAFTLSNAMPIPVDPLTITAPSDLLSHDSVLRLIQLVEGVGGRAEVYFADDVEGWDVGIRGKKLQIQIHDAHLPTVLVTLMGMDNWMTVDIHASFIWTMVLANIVVDGGGYQVEEAMIGPGGEITGYVTDRRKLRFCIGNVGVRFHIPSPGQSRPRCNVDVLLETEGDIDDLYFTDT